MNPSTFLGMLIAIILVAATMISGTTNITVFMNLPGLAIVIGGTIAATLISYPMAEVLRVFWIFIVVLRNERLYTKEDLEELVTVSRMKFRGKLEAAENQVDKLKNPYLKIGLQLVMDGSPLEDVLALMQWRIRRLKAKEQAEANIFRTMAVFSPAFGMMGTLIGLINMLGTMDSKDIAVLGSNMAIALVTTFYGILLANLIFKPIAIKLERRTEQRVMLMQMVMEGITLMSQERSPAYIRAALESFMMTYEDEINEDRDEIFTQPAAKAEESQAGNVTDDRQPDEKYR